MAQILKFPKLGFSLSDDDAEAVIAAGQGTVSVSGVQEKFSAVEENGALRLTAEGERGTYILKPVPLNNAIAYRKQLPANEFLTMQIASCYGIETADCGLVEDSKGHPVYVTRRFDIDASGRKIKQEDFASILGRNDIGGDKYKYSGSYEEIAQAIRRYIPAWPVAIERFFRMVVFNYIYANGDAHLKNFSIICRDGEYSLAPAYDLINTRIHVNDADFAMDGGLSPKLEPSDAYCAFGHPCRLDFERFAGLIGLQPRRSARILDQFMAIPDSTVQLVHESQLVEKLQRHYLAVIRERTSRFVRK